MGDMQDTSGETKLPEKKDDSILGKVKRGWKTMVKALRDDDQGAREEVLDEASDHLPVPNNPKPAIKKHNQALEDAYEQSNN